MIDLISFLRLLNKLYLNNKNVVFNLNNYFFFFIGIKLNLVKMPVRGNTFKIFIGNLSDRTTNDDLRGLFEAHGTVVEADAVKNYGFVHMQNEEEGKAAIEALNGTTLHGKVKFNYTSFS